MGLKGFLGPFKSKVYKEGGGGPSPNGAYWLGPAQQDGVGLYGVHGYNVAPTVAALRKDLALAVYGQQLDEFFH